MIHPMFIVSLQYLLVKLNVCIFVLTYTHILDCVEYVKNQVLDVLMNYQYLKLIKLA